MANQELYTCGRWEVAAGREEEFVTAWTELAEWSAANVAGASWATLLQEGSAGRFISVGPWASLDAIEGWRASAGFQERLGRIRAMLEGFEPGVFRRRAGVGTG